MYIKQENADKFFSLLKDCNLYSINKESPFKYDIPNGTRIISSRCGVHQKSVGKWCWEVDIYEIGSCEPLTNVIKAIKQGKKIWCETDGEIFID